MTLSTLLLMFGVTFVFIGVAAAGIFWAIRSGQYDDMEGAAQRILMDDDDPMVPFERLNYASNQHRIKPSKKLE